MVEVRAAELAALRADEDEASLPWFGEPLQVPADLRGDLGWERHRAPTGPRLGRIRSQAALVELSQRFGDPNFAGVQIDVLAPEPSQLAQAHVREGGEQDECAVPHRNGFRELEDDGQRDDGPLV